MFDNWKKKKIEELRKSELVEFHNEQQLEDMRKLMKKKRKSFHKDNVLDFNDFKVAFFFDFKEDVKIIARGLMIAGDAQVQVGDIECSQYIEVDNDSELYAGDINCKDLTVGYRSYLEAKNIDVGYVKDSVPVEINGSIKANDIKINLKGINFNGEDDERCEYTFNDIISKGDINVSEGTLKANDVKASNISFSGSNVNIRDVYARLIEGTSCTFTARDININEIRGWLNITARDITGKDNSYRGPILEANEVKARTVQGDKFFDDIRVHILEAETVYSDHIRATYYIKANQIRYSGTCVVVGTLKCEDISDYNDNSGLLVIDRWEGK